MAALALRPLLVAAALLALLVSAQEPGAEPPAGDGLDLGDWLADHLGPGTGTGTGAGEDGGAAGAPPIDAGASEDDSSTSADWSSDMSSSCSACVDPDTVVLPDANVTACLGQPAGTIVSQVIRVPVPGTNGTLTQAIRFNVTCGQTGNPLENDQSFSDSSASNSPGNDGGEDEIVAVPSPAPAATTIAQPPIAAAASGASWRSVGLGAALGLLAAAAAGARV